MSRNGQAEDGGAPPRVPMKARTIFIIFVGPPFLIALAASAASFWIKQSFLTDYWRDWLSTFGALGTLGTLIGLAVAIWQIVRTRSAADAANQAASETKDRITRLSALVDLTRLSSQSNEVLVLLREERVDGAALRLWDLRTSLVQFRHSPQGKLVMKPKQWTEMMANVRQLEEALQDKNAPSDGKEATVTRHRKAMSDIHERLIGLAASAAYPGE